MSSNEPIVYQPINRATCTKTQQLNPPSVSGLIQFIYTPRLLHTVRLTPSSLSSWNSFAYASSNSTPLRLPIPPPILLTVWAHTTSQYTRTLKYLSSVQPACRTFLRWLTVRMHVEQAIHVSKLFYCPSFSLTSLQVYTARALWENPCCPNGLGGVNHAKVNKACCCIWRLSLCEIVEWCL